MNNLREYSIARARRLVLDWGFRILKPAKSKWMTRVRSEMDSDTGWKAQNEDIAYPRERAESVRGLEADVEPIAAGAAAIDV